MDPRPLCDPAAARDWGCLIGDLLIKCVFSA
jgi:hypothetical protein